MLYQFYHRESMILGICNRYPVGIFYLLFYLGKTLKITYFLIFFLNIVFYLLALPGSDWGYSICHPVFPEYSICWLLSIYIYICCMHSDSWYSVLRCATLPFSKHLNIQRNCVVQTNSAETIVDVSRQIEKNMPTFGRACCNIVAVALLHQFVPCGGKSQF